MPEHMFELMGFSPDEASELGQKYRARRAGQAVPMTSIRSRRSEMVLPTSRGRGEAILALKENLVSDFPGVDKQGPRDQPLGIPIAVFINAGATTLIRTANPQKPIKGHRLCLIVTRVGAAATNSGLVTLDRLEVGTVSQLASGDPLPAEGFSADAVGMGLVLASATPGILILAQYTLAAPALAVGDTVSVSGMLISLTGG